jgi:activator of 2-hydroxyglutaryl-CoA dehydratase
MVQKLKNYKTKLTGKFCQIIANSLVTKMEASLDSDDYDSFNQEFEMAAKLNAYCIVFHNIYLD